MNLRLIQLGPLRRFVVLFFVVSLLHSAEQGSAAPKQVREVIIERIVTNPAGAFGVILKEKAGERRLLIFVGQPEGRAIIQGLDRTPTPRPSPHDLIVTLLAELHGVVQRVTVTRAEAGTMFASITLQGSDNVSEIDARPSDAIAVAVKTKAPIFANSALLSDGPQAEGLPTTWPAAAAPAVSPAAPANIPEPTFADVVYAEVSPLQKLDLYLPPEKSRLAPLVIWIHGGGWRVGDKRSMPNRNFAPPPKPAGPMGPYQIQVPDVAALNAKGYAVVSLNYRLGGPPGVVQSMQDAKAAVRFLRASAEKYHLDAGKFAVWGNSAGGYMAAMLGATGDQITIFDDPALGHPEVSSAVQAVVVWYGAEDRLPGRELSIAHYLATAKTIPPHLIANGDADLVISAYQAQRLRDSLRQEGATVALTIIPGAGHEDPAFMATQMAPTFAFLDKTFGR